MTALRSMHLQFILQNITLTNYYIYTRHTQITSIHSNVYVDINKNNRVNKMTTLNSIHLQIVLHYIILTNYHIVKDTLR